MTTTDCPPLPTRITKSLLGYGVIAGEDLRGRRRRATRTRAGKAVGVGVRTDRGVRARRVLRRHLPGRSVRRFSARHTTGHGRGQLARADPLRGGGPRILLPGRSLSGDGRVVRARERGGLGLVLAHHWNRVRGELHRVVVGIGRSHSGFGVHRSGGRCLGVVGRDIGQAVSIFEVARIAQTNAYAVGTFGHGSSPAATVDFRT